jgi:hypothetical protein
MLFALGKDLLASIAQVKVGSVSVHRFSIFPGIKRVMAECKNSTKKERSYGRYERFPFLMTRRLDFGQSIAGMGLPMSKRSASAPPVLLVQQGCGFQRTLLGDHHVLLPSLLEWWEVTRHMNNRHSSSEWFKREEEKRLFTMRSGKAVRLLISVIELALSI